MECPICFENKNDFYLCEICKESICTDCKKTWKKDCPYCRARYIAPMSDTDIEESRPLLFTIQEREPVRRWTVGHIICACLFGGTVTWWAFYPG